MPAKDYMLATSPLSNCVYITRSIGKLDKREVTKGEMMNAIVSFTKSQLKKDEKVMIILHEGQPVAEVKLLK